MEIEIALVHSDCYRYPYFAQKKLRLNPFTVSCSNGLLYHSYTVIGRFNSIIWKGIYTQFSES